MKEHLVKRHLDLKLHRPSIDDVEKSATFFLYNLSGQVVGYQQYKPFNRKVKANDPHDGRYHTYRSKFTLGVWGVESLYLTTDVLFVAVGIFDSCRLTEKGVSYVATLSNNPSAALKNWFYMLNKKIVVVCDNDKAGHALSKFGQFTEVPDSHDLGDCSEEYIDFLITKYVKK